MEIKILKIDNEFTIVELGNGEKKVCPIQIFPEEIKMGSIVLTKIVDKF